MRLPGRDSIEGMEIHLKLKGRRYQPRHRYLPGEVDRLERWLSGVLGMAGDALECVVVHGVLAIHRKAAEPSDVFAARARAFIAEVVTHLHS
jgi:hypothetical protein